MFHGVNLINNLYNFVKFNRETLCADPFSPGRALNLHLGSGQRGRLGSLSPHYLGITVIKILSLLELSHAFSI